ncbi:Xaa-Pro aminopeptidase [Neisseriaceae bacterium ESL0693]|nr:Xaa-Pro aminopeptidase [Neisseriaceae bacterium ESL0693]
MNPDYCIYQQRRQRVLQQLGQDGIAIIFAAPEQRRSNDTEFPFRQDSYFYYLTGFPEPESALILNGREQSALLLCRDKDAEREIWTGFRYGPAAARDLFGFDAADSIDQWPQQLSKALPGHRQLLALWGLYPEHDRQIMPLWHTMVQQSGYRAASKGTIAPSELVNLAPMLDQMRLYKDEYEQSLMRTAAEISAQAHIRAMQTTRPGQFEYQVEAEILHEFMMRGARFPSYNSIVAGGKNACCLHYVDNAARLNSGDLLMIDAGAEYQMYAGDISRTFPVNGRFTPAQKAVYEIVLAVNQTSITATVTGADWQQISQQAIHQLTQGLIDLGLLQGSVERNIETNAYRRFYMHGLGHWLGLDVHDVGGRFNGQGEPLLLQPGMVTTVEPGLYIAAADDIPPEFHHIGVRIEDNVLVKESGNEVLTASVPKDIDAIEALMHH